jgi:hypothetical protein
MTSAVFEESEDVLIRLALNDDRLIPFAHWTPRARQKVYRFLRFARRSGLPRISSTP